MGRTYGDAVAALNTLQSNHAIVDAIRNSGRGMNKQAIPEMIEWCRRIGYEPVDLDPLKPIHIAGTKGKGSTCAFVSSILSQYIRSSEEGKPGLRKIGLYISPHLRSVRERIQINNVPLSEEDFARYFFSTWDRLEASARERGLPTDTAAKPVYFRFLTLMAFHAFLEEGVDTAVIETGIGGEYDSTNVLLHPTVVGITSLGIDHVAMLGDTIGEIAWHKAGIMKAGARAFTVPQPEPAMEVLWQRAKEKGVALTVVARHPALEQMALGLAGDFQKTNASLAISVAAAHLQTLGFQGMPTDISRSELPDEFRRGLETVQWGGRCDRRRIGKVAWFIDGGHTLESIRVAGEWYSQEIHTTDQTHRTAAKPLKRVLIFNQQTRDAVALAKALHETLTSTTSPADRRRPFTNVVFCTNVTFKEGGYKADLVSLNTSGRDVDDLSVQRGLATAWREIESGIGGAETEVRVVRTIEEAVAYVEGLASSRGGPGQADGRRAERSDRRGLGQGNERGPERGPGRGPERGNGRENRQGEDGVEGKDGSEGEADTDKEEVVALVTGSLHLVGGLLEVLEQRKGQ